MHYMWRIMDITASSFTYCEYIVRRREISSMQQIIQFDEVVVVNSSIYADRRLNEQRKI